MEAQMTDPQGQLLRLLDLAYEAELAFVANLSNDQLQAEGQPDRWAPKDFLAHIAAWNAREVDEMEAASRGETLGESDELNDINAGIFEGHRGWSWTQIMQLLEQAHLGMSAAVTGLSTGDLTDPQRFAWTHGQPLIQRLAFTAYSHALTHLSYVLWDSGERQAAVQMSELIASQMSALIDSERWQANQLYNLACFYAMTGDPQRALELLRVAFPMHSDLATFAQEDNELASLWDDPQFKSLISV
jgi:hypothetical protein